MASNHIAYTDRHEFWLIWAFDYGRALRASSAAMDHIVNELRM